MYEIELSNPTRGTPLFTSVSGIIIPVLDNIELQ